MHKHIGKYRNASTNKIQDVWLHFVRGASALSEYLSAGVECYKDVFAGPPYFENYDGQEKDVIEPMFDDFASNGILVFATAIIEPQKSEMVGFAASISADRSEVADFLRQHAHRLDAPIGNFLYMAEVAVRHEYRKQGLGSLFVHSRIEEARTAHVGKFTHILMRTAAEGSNSAGIYRRMGAKEIPELIQEKNDFESKSNKRIFLSKPLN